MKKRILIGIVVVTMIGAFFTLDLGQFFSLSYLQDQKAALAAAYQQNKALFVLVYFLIYVFSAAIALPAAAVLTLAAGAFFGFSAGLFLASFASSIGATLAFLLTRYLFHDYVQQRFAKQLTTINEGVESEGPFYLFALRLVPLFPFFVINSLMAFTNIKAWTFYWVSQLGMLLGTAVYVNAGTQLASINSTSDIVSPALILSFVVLGLFPLVAKKTLGLIRQENATGERN